MNVTQIAMGMFHTYVRQANGQIMVTQTNGPTTNLHAYMPDIVDFVVHDRGFIALDSSNQVYINYAYSRSIYRINLGEIVPKQLGINLLRTPTTDADYESINPTMKRYIGTRHISFQILTHTGDMYQLEPELVNIDSKSDWHVVTAHHFAFTRIATPQPIRQLLSNPHDTYHHLPTYYIGSDAHVYQVTSFAHQQLESIVVGSIPATFENVTMQMALQPHIMVDTTDTSDRPFVSALIDGKLHIDVLNTRSSQFALSALADDIQEHTCISTPESLLLLARHTDGTLSLEVMKGTSDEMIHTFIEQQPLFTPHPLHANLLQIHGIPFSGYLVMNNQLETPQLFGIVDSQAIYPILTAESITSGTFPDTLIYTPSLPAITGHHPPISAPVTAWNDALYWITPDGVVNQLSWINDTPSITSTLFTDAVAVAVVAGAGHLTVLHANGHVSSADPLTPVGITHIAELTAGEFNTYARRHDGRVIAWGRNDNYIVSRIHAMTNIQTVVGGRHHALLLTQEGHIIHLGARAINEADTYPLYSHGVRMIAGADFCAMAWLNDGRVVDLFDRSIPTITTANDIAQIACSRSLYAIRTQTGDTTIIYRYSLSASEAMEWPPISLNNVAYISATAHMVIVVFDNGQVRAWYSDEQFGVDPVELSVPPMVRCRF